MKNLLRYLCGLCLTGLFLTGCYRDDLAYIHNKIDALELRSITEQIDAMKDGIAELKALQEQLTPAVKALQEAKEGISKDIAAIQARIDAGETLSTELQAQLISLQSKYKALDAVYKILSDSRLIERTGELEALVASSNSEFKDRMTALETAAQTLATIKQMAEIGAAMSELKAVVDVLPSEFQNSFDDAFSKCKESVLQWISDSEAFKDLFKDYYSISEFEALLDVLRGVDAARAQELSDLKNSVEKTDKDIRALVEDAVSGTNKKISERLEAVNAIVKDLSSRMDGLLARVSALEKLYDVVGDYSGYRSNLISDIQKLRELVGEDDTLLILANTLKLVLSQSEQSYYDLGQIVKDIASVSGGLSDQEGKIKAYEELVKSLAAVEKFTALKEEVVKLSSDINDLESASAANIQAVQALAQRIDDIVAKWTDATFEQVSGNSADIIRLKEEDAKLRLALEEAVRKGNERNEADYKEIIGLLAKVNESLAALKVEDFIKQTGDLQKAVEDINKLLEECGVGEIKGLQNILSSLDSRIKSLDSDISRIWDMIGNETLSIEGSLINAINVLNSRFGGVEGIKGISDALQNDLALIKNILSEIIGGEQAPSLTELKGLLDKLSEAISGKADKSALPAIEEALKGIQKGLAEYTVELDGKLSDYIKTEDAAKVYATTVLLGSLIDSYNTYVGDFDKAFANESGSVIVAVAALGRRVGDLESGISDVAEKIKAANGGISDANGIIGVGTLGEWAADLTDAVNYLYSLVDGKSVSQQATQITQSVISALVQAILGKEGDASAIKSLLDGFESSFSGFSDSLGALFDNVGDISGLVDAQNPDIAAMIKNIRTELAGLSDLYAQIGHGHVFADITGLKDALDTISDNLDVVSKKLDDLEKYVNETLLGLIDALEKKFEGYTTPDYVNALIATLHNILAGAVLGGGDDFGGYFASLNLTELSKRIQDILDTDINNIIKKNGTIDQRAKQLVDNAFGALNIESYLTSAGYKADILEKLKEYASNSSLEEFITIVTAMSNLDIAIGDKKFSYYEFDKAVEYIYSELSKNLSELDADYKDFLAKEFKDVKDRLDAIYPLIGGGFKDKTITEVINEVLLDITDIDGLIEGIQETLKGVVDREKTDRELISGLQDVQKSLIDALFGGTVPASGIPQGGYVADFEKRISALEDALSKIGFDTIKNSEGKTLAVVISEINTKLSDIKATIGGDFDKDNTLEKAISDLNKALESLVSIDDENGSTQRLAALSEKLQSLLAALGGSDALMSLSGLEDNLNDILLRLDDFRHSNRSVEESMADLKLSIDTLFNLVDTEGTGLDGTLVDLISKLSTTAKNLQVLDDAQLSEISYQLGDITYQIVIAKLRTGLYDSSGLGTAIMIVLRIAMTLSNILEWDGLTEFLSTSIQELAAFASTEGDLGKLSFDAESLVDAINHLCDLLGVTKGDLSDLRAAILGGSEAQSLSELVRIFNELKGLVGESTDSKTVIEALLELDGMVDALDGILGNNTTGYSDVWSALSDLNAAFIGCLYRINSLVFMPDYDDGKATYDKNGVVMQFKVNASSAFFERFGTESFNVNGYLKTSALKGKGASIKGSARLSGDVLTVTYGADQFSGKNLGSAAQVAVAIVDGVGEVFISEYVSLAL